jgi:nucleoside-diphosphate-sugar epimerase
VTRLRSYLGDYTYIDDIVDGVILALDKPKGYEVYNLGSGNTTVLADFVAAVEVAGQVEALKQDEDEDDGKCKYVFIYSYSSFSNLYICVCFFLCLFEIYMYDLIGLQLTTYIYR